METLTFTSSTGEIVTFGAQFPYLLGNVTGIGEADIVPQLSPAYGINGQIYRGTLMGVRFVKFDFWLNAATHEDLHTIRRAIQKALNPLDGEGELVYENDNAKYRIPAAVIYGPVVMAEKGTERTRTEQHFEVGFGCYQPLWESFIEYSRKIVGLTGGLTFPMELPFTLATVADNTEIENIGDTETPVRVEFRGPATDVTITKLASDGGTNKIIAVTYTLLAGEKLIVDTDKRNPTVTFVSTTGAESSAFNKIDVDSDFWNFQLDTGLNTISFTATAGTPEVYIYWRYRYAGV